MTTVYYHGNCADGFASALAVKLKYPEYNFQAIQRNWDEIEFRRENKIFVDICPPYEVIRELSKSGFDILILDHHQTAKADFDRAMKEGLIMGTFDIDHSGAMLAYNHFKPNIPSRFFELVEDRDLWRFKLEGAKELNAYLRTQPWDFVCILGVANNIDESIARGKYILQQISQAVDTICNNWFLEEICGVLMPVVNSPIYQSEIGSRLLEKLEQFHVVAIRYENQSQIVTSLRSLPHFDCSVLAEREGGGGHKNASGFVKEKKW